MAKSLPLDELTVCVVTPCLSATVVVPSGTGDPVTVSSYQWKVTVPDKPFDVTSTDASTVSAVVAHVARRAVSESMAGDVDVVAVAVADAVAVTDADVVGLEEVFTAVGLAVCTALLDGVGVGVALCEGVRDAAAADAAAATDGVTCVVAPTSDAGLASDAFAVGGEGE